MVTSWFPVASLQGRAHEESAEDRPFPVRGAALLRELCGCGQHPAALSADLIHGMLFRTFLRGDGYIVRSGVLSHLKVAMQFLCSASSHLISTYLVCLRLDDHKSQLPNQGLPRQSPPYTPSPACTGPVLLLFCWLSPHENQSLTILCPKKMMFFVLLFFCSLSVFVLVKR